MRYSERKRTIETMANAAPLGGTCDFLPRDVLRRTYAVEIIERVYQSYGFEPLETPAMEQDGRACHLPRWPVLAPELRDPLGRTDGDHVQAAH